LQTGDQPQTFTSHEFNQHAGEAQKAATSILQALTPSAELAAKLTDIELEIPPRSKAQRQPVNFTED